jgi:antitoxin (DNA-binding transcriptional repressor) of toxin-antitoxin stability system
MPVIGLRQLSRETADVIAELKNSGEAFVITKQGRPVATLTRVDETQAQDLVLSLAPRIRESSSTAEVEVSPTKTRSLDEVSKQLAKEASRSDEGQRALAKYSDDLAKQRSEVLTALDRLFSEGQARLSGMTPSLITAWTDSTQKLIEGAVQAALDSARTLQERAGTAGEPATRASTASKARARTGSKARLAGRSNRAKRGARTSKATRTKATPGRAAKARSGAARTSSAPAARKTSRSSRSRRTAR